MLLGAFQMGIKLRVTSIFKLCLGTQVPRFRNQDGTLRR